MAKTSNSNKEKELKKLKIQKKAIEMSGSSAAIIDIQIAKLEAELAELNTEQVFRSENED